LLAADLRAFAHTIKRGVNLCLDLICPRDLIDGTDHPGPAFSSETRLHLPTLKSALSYSPNLFDRLPLRHVVSLSSEIRGYGSVPWTRNDHTKPQKQSLSKAQY
jgi:hypothetical protein